MTVPNFRNFLIKSLGGEATLQVCRCWYIVAFGEVPDD